MPRIFLYRGVEEKTHRGYQELTQEDHQNTIIQVNNKYSHRTGAVETAPLHNNYENIVPEICLTKYDQSPKM
jgi:hypothetical protein